MLLPKLPGWAKKTGYIIGIGIFVVGSIVSGYDLFSRNLSFKLYPIVIAAILSLTGLFISIVRFKYLASSIGVDVPLSESRAIVVWGGVANFLPIPAGLLMRIGYLGRKTSIYRASLVNMMGAGIWLFSASTICAVVSMSSGELYYAPLFSVFSLSTLAVTLIIALQLKAGLFQVFVVTVFQVLMSLTTVLRIILISHALNLDFSLFWASVIAISGVVASLSGFSPGGLGITEMLASSIAVIAGMTATSGFSIAVVNRFLSWIALGVFLPLTPKLRDYDNKY